MTTYVTVNDITPKIQYSATAGQTVFTFPFIAFADTDLKVYVNDVLKTITTDYTVDNDYPAEGGEITFTAGLTLNDIVTIVRDTPLDKVTGWVTGGDFKATTLDDQNARFVAGLQQLDAKIDRAARLSDTTQVAEGAFIVPEPEDGKTLKWDGTTGTMVNSDNDPDEIVTLAAAQAAAAAASASAAAASLSAAGLPDPATANTYLKRNVGNTAYDAKSVDYVGNDVASTVLGVANIPAGREIGNAFTSSASCFSTTSNTFQDVLSLAYSAQAANSIVEVTVCGMLKADYDFGASETDAVVESYAQLNDGTTTRACVQITDVGRTNSSGRRAIRVPFSYTYRFTPGSTSAVTYKLQQRAGTSGHESEVALPVIAIREIKGA